MAEEIINPEEEVQLINEKIVQYLEASLDILDTSDLMNTNFSIVINNDKRLKALASEYRLISVIRRQKEQMKGKVLDISGLMPALRQIIFQIQSDKNAYRLVEADLAKIIRDLEILEKVLEMTRNIDEFRININVVLKNIDQLSQEKLKVQIRNRILSIKNKLEELKIVYDGDTLERLVDTLWKHCRKQISGPVFLTGHPKLVSPLSKSMEKNPELTERFQIIIAGAEVGNGFSELNDPIDQAERFEMQQKLLKAGDKEAMMPDKGFVEMLEYGMPPTCGFGFGELLFAFLADKPLRETQFFPLMKPKNLE